MSNWFKAPPQGSGGDPAGRLENAACRKALALAGVNPAGVARQAGLGPINTARLTFSALAAFAEFPASPHVTDEPPDEVGSVLTKFVRTRLYAAWLGFEDDAPEVRSGARAMIFRGVTWGTAVLYEIGNRPVPAGRSSLTLGFPGRDLRIEPYAGWLRTIGWVDQDPPDGNSEDNSDF